MKSEELKTEELNEVYGGSKQELDELSEFIHQVQPSYEIRDPSDIIIWLYKYSGISFPRLFLKAPVWPFFSVKAPVFNNACCFSLGV